MILIKMMTLFIGVLLLVYTPSTVKNKESEETKMENIQTKKASELRFDKWIDANGNETTPVRLSQYKGKFKVIYCFQHWCPGCHKVGLPALQQLVSEFGGSDKIAFMAVQTVFEGAHINTYDKLKETQEKYGLKIPFGHDEEKGRSTIMQDYNTRGTPWFIFVDQNNNVVFEDFHINVPGAIEYLRKI